jgi:uncharacterized protein YfaS (alpha-2-macroglobulin family)
VLSQFRLKFEVIGNNSARTAVNFAPGSKSDPVNAMKTPLRFLTFVLCALFSLRIAHAQTPMDLQQQADKAFDEKSYARALELYRSAKAAGPVREPEKVDYRIVLSLFKTEKWDDAIDSANFALNSAVWKARFHYALGQIYVKAPKGGWKLGDKTWRQDEYPTVQGDQKPQRASFYEEDQKSALDALETAKIEAQKERDIAMRSRFATPIFPLSRDEEDDLNFDLAAYLPTVEFDELIAALEKRDDGKFDEVVDPKTDYATGWSLPKKVLTLYAEIRVLDPNEDKSDTARSYLAEGLFLRAYLQRMEGWAPKYDQATQKTVKRPYPFDSLDSITPWRRLVTELPKSVLAPQALLLIAQQQEGQGQLVKAAATWRELIAKYPQSKLVSDARSSIQGIEQKQINFNLKEPARPGQKPQLLVTSRNLKEVRFAAYRVKLEDFLTQKTSLNNPSTTFTEFSSNFGTITAAVKKFGAPVARWSAKTGDNSDHQGNSFTTQAPFSEIGAYAIVASSGDVRFAQIILITDLALLKKADKNGSFVYVADAKSGAAVNGAAVVVKEVWGYDPRKADVAQGKSDDAGFFDKKRAGDSGSNFAAFAWVGNRYAITGQQGGYWGGEDRDQTRVLGTTDRPVYRPGQTVNFRQIVTTRNLGGDWRPLVKREFSLVATNPKGETFWEKKLTTNEFGSVSGEFVIPESAPLGQFNLGLTDNQNISGGIAFRVEEYKRPEFEVTVTAPTEAKRPGEMVAARINAKYYFGAPVPNAKVKYTVRKSTWWAGYRFPTPYDWLYSNWGVGQYDTGRRNIGGEGSGKIVKEGEVTTDAQGYAELTFLTEALENTPGDWWSRYSNPLYTIEAQVTDQSRRTIEAQGSVKVARQPYFAFLNTQRGYFQTGDRVPIELRTQDANEQSVAATGKMVVYKLLPGDKEEKVFEEAISTDASGRTFWNWEAKDSGQFRVEYQAKGLWGDDIKAQTEVWVVGDRIGAIRLRGVTILLDKNSYEQGDTLKARIIADKPGANVLLTQEAAGEILRRDVVAIDQQSKEVSIPIEKKHVPNFFIAAALIQDFEVYQAQAEVFVPPTRQLLNIKVTGDKATYKPGETGTFQVEARDYSGQPARAEVSLALIDASLFYIQKDYTPDMRQFYYGERRYNSVNLDSNRSGNPEARSENDAKTTNYETHGFELPDDFGQLQLMPGGFGYYPMRGVRIRFAIGAEFGGGSVSNRLSALESRPVPEAAFDMAAPAAPMMAARKAANGPASSTGVLDQAPTQVRSNFAETAYWSPSVITEGGKATVKVTFPDSLTQWHATARGLTQTVQVGSAETDVATKKDLLVRLQAPRFFVERDEVVISANVHNYSDKAKSMAVRLDSSLKLTGAVAQTLQLGAGEEKRLNWTASIEKAGEATLQVSAKSDTDSDAVKMTFPVLVHGVQRFGGQSGVIASDGSTKITLNFPSQRKLGASELNLQLTPSLGAQMLDALPYLSDYPYGCVEQTMSRFLPTVMTAKTLRDAGIDLETLRTRAKAYAAEAKTEARGTRVQNSGYSYPKGQPNSRDLEEMASQLWYRGRSNNPIFDRAEMDRMTSEGLNRLYGMQRSDGGWGWWPGSGSSDEYMSAYVVYGLSQAKSAGIAVRADALNRGTAYLRAQMKDEDNLHLLTYIAYALSQTKLDGEAKNIAANRLFEQRERLTPLSKAYLAMALSSAGEKEKAGVLIRNLENTVQIDAANGTARYKTAPQYWYWWNNDVETVALALRAFDQVEPNNKLVPMLMKWLTLQARASHYRSTKETAEVVYTLADYVTKNKELDVDYTLKVGLNGKIARTYRVTKDNALFFDNRFITGDLFLENGANTLTIEKSGKGKVYWNAYTEYFSLEEPIKASGNELDISRKFYKLTRKAVVEEATSNDMTTTVAVDAAPRRGRGGIIRPRPMPTPEEPEYTRTEIKDSDEVTSSDLIEVELVVNAKNDYEYLVFEDMKAAGFEPVEVRSGQSYGDGLSSNVELRDEKVAFFVDRLPQGRRVLRYRVRAEVPGTFHALPTNGYAMYAPEVRAISDEMRVSVKD